MKPTFFLLAAAAALASSGCNAEGNGNGGTANQGAAAVTEAVEPPADGDWSKVVTRTPEGGFAMGNPNAEVKLVEFASMTCPHCAEFDNRGVPPLVENYVKTGQVRYEFRNFVRDPFDITTSLIARCNGADSFFPLTHALFDNQEEWIQKIQSAPESELQAATALGPERQFVAIAQLADLQKWAAQRGVPTAKSTQCLADQDAINQLVQMNSDTTSEYPNFAGTPSFAINGELQEQTATWEALEPKLRSALGS